MYKLINESDYYSKKLIGEKILLYKTAIKKFRTRYYSIDILTKSQNYYISIKLMLMLVYHNKQQIAL